MKNITNFINEYIDINHYIDLDPNFEWKNGVEFLFLSLSTNDYGFLTEN